ncbi:MAG TPA: xanthine dehydrogenase family protein molybdopterin-binding subunit [Candidatus Acidoferrales bacterium]|nr:xanthine dehydrogenase family protein molybdopterin-binding subunit [Candidatus Acidoferrales bacterium]
MGKVPAMSVKASESVRIGERIRRREAERLIAGKGTFVDDVPLAGTLYVGFVRSPYAHARIKSIDARAARSMGGVHAVVTGDDLVKELAEVRGGPARHVKVYPLAVGKVRYVGEPVAAVAADTRYLAEDAAENIAVEYEPLPAVVDPEKAMEESSAKLFDELESNIVYEYHFSTPDLDAVFQRADHVFSLRLNSHRLTPFPMEPRAYAAEYDAREGTLTCWASTAGPHGFRTRLAEILGFPESKLRVIAPDVGGSFGVKNGGYQDEVIVPLLALKLGRPVKWAETRIEHLRSARQGRDQIHYIDVAVNGDGTVVAIRDKIIADLGCSYGIDNSISSAALYVPGVYRIRNYRVDAYGIATNKANHGSLRGIGKAEAAFVIERTMDIVARRLGMDPVELRKKNFIPPEAFPYRSVTGALYDSGQYEKCLDQALELARYQQAKEEKKRLRGEGVYRGVGVAFVMEPTSSSRIYATGGYATCRIRIEPSGSVTVFSSVGDQGQGHGTTLSAIVASRIGFPLDKIFVIRGDTGATPYGFGTGSSRSSVVQMNAAYLAAERLREKLVKIAARNLRVPAKELAIRDGKISSAEDPTKSMSLREIVRLAYGAIHLLPEDEEPGLEVTSHFINPNIDYVADERGRMNTFSTYPYAAIVAVVDVDIETGFVKIVRYCTVHDCGNIINPQIVETQHYGSVVQGIGAAIYEHIVYDDEGQLLTASLMDYKVPTVEEVPDIQLGHLVTPSPFSPLGTKGAGETGMLGPPPALASAIEDALAEFGAEIRSTPYTPERVLALIREARKGSLRAGA